MANAGAHEGLTSETASGSGGEGAGARVAGRGEEEGRVDAFGGGVVVDMQLEGIGVSLIDNEPRELIYMCLSSLRLRAHRSRAQQAVQLLLAHLQVDAAVPTAKFPVMLAPLPQPAPTSSSSSASSSSASSASSSASSAAAADGAMGDGPLLELSVTHNREWHYDALVYLEYVGAALKPLRLQLEQNTTARLLRLVDSLDRTRRESARKSQQQADRAAASLGRLQHASLVAAAACAPDAIARAAASRSPLAPRRPRGDDGSGRAGTARTSGVGGAPSAGVPVILNKFYIEELTFHQIVVKLTMQMDEQCDDKALQPFHPMNSLGAFAHVVSAPLSLSLSLDQMLIRDVFEPGDAILDRIYQRYEMSIKYQLLKLIGSKLIGHRHARQPSRDLCRCGRRRAPVLHPAAEGSHHQVAQGLCPRPRLGRCHCGGWHGPVRLPLHLGRDQGAGIRLCVAHTRQQVHVRAAARRANGGAQHAAGHPAGRAALPSGALLGRHGRGASANPGREAPRREGLRQRDGQGRHRYHCQADLGHRRAISKTAEGAASEVKQLTGGKEEVMLRVRQPRSCPSAPRRAPWMVAAPPCCCPTLGRSRCNCEVELQIDAPAQRAASTFHTEGASERDELQLRYAELGHASWIELPLAHFIVHRATTVLMMYGIRRRVSGRTLS